jgi:putative CocE/NonD family hydrolase
MRGAFQAWAHIQAPKKLFIGPPDTHWPWATYHDELLAWYDYYLKGIDTGVEEQPPVRYWLQGANCWKTAEDWPVPGTSKQRLYLASTSEDPFHAHRLQDQLPEQETSLSFLAVPRGMEYPKELEKYISQKLLFETDPFSEDTEMVGPIRLHLKLSSTAIDTHVIARLSDVSSTGEKRVLAFGWLQASHRKVDETLSRADEIIHEHRIPEPLHPKTPVLLDFSLTPTANLFKRGHCLRLEIGSRSDLLNATIFDNFVFYPYEAPPYPARNTTYVGGQAASYLEIDLRYS